MYVWWHDNMQDINSTSQAKWRLFQQRWKLFMQDNFGLWGLAIVIIFILVALLAPLLAPYDPNHVDLNIRLQGMSWAHLFGTDDMGRDILSRIIFGARTSFLIVVMVPFIAAPIGLLVGVISAYFGGWVDTFFMRLTDIFLTFPKLILALAFVAVLGPKLENAILAIALTSWPPYARICRTKVQAFVQADFMRAAHLQGISEGRLLLYYLPPLCTSTLVVRISLEMGGVILTAAALSFLGLGAQPPTAEWGSMCALGRNFLFHEWWVCVFPGIAIFITSIGFNLLGNGIRDALDPKKQEH